MAELRLENLSKTFPGKTQVRAVENVSFTASPGECVALLGPSGGGKSTILRLVAGLETPTSGGILIDGVAVENSAPADRQVSMAFQYPALLPQLNVAENLRLGPKLRGQKDIDSRVAEIADLLSLNALLARKPETLSGGEQQRVALGRALIVKPRVLLLDEPLASLDPLARVELREVIHRIQKELRLTTLYVTHDQTEAAAIADRIALLHGGALQQISTPRESYSDPRNLFAARFFGLDRLNLVRAKLVQRANEWLAEADGIKVQLNGTPLRTIGDLAIGFRPSAIRISENGEWTVKGCRDFGWTRTLCLGCATVEIVAEDRGSSLQPGKRMGVEIDSSAIFLFDLESGDRLL
jgi:multiple sugar transport system ATP-binding protein